MVSPCRRHAITLFAVATLVVRNQRIIDAFEARQAENRRRLEAGLRPKTRCRRRKTVGNWQEWHRAPAGIYLHADLQRGHNR